MEALVNVLLAMLAILGIIVVTILIFAVVFVFIFALCGLIHWMRQNGNADDDTGGLSD